MREQATEQADQAQRHGPRVGRLEHGGEQSVVHRRDPGHEEHRCRGQQQLPLPAKPRVEPLGRERGDPEKEGLQQNSWVEGPVFAKELCPEPRGLRAMAQASA